MKSDGIHNLIELDSSDLGEKLPGFIMGISDTKDTWNIIGFKLALLG